MYDIIEKYGLPREYCSCPGCGRLYGHHNTKVCLHCSECSTCCKERPQINNCGENRKLVDATEFITNS